MKLFIKSILSITLAFLFVSCNARQNEEQAKAIGSITIKDSWARTANKGANSSVYLTIVNNSAAADTLLHLKTDAAKMASVHKTYRDENGMTGMRHVKNTVIEPGSKFVLEPGGYHVMLMNLSRSLQKGDTLKLTLMFAQAGKRVISVPVK